MTLRSAWLWLLCIIFWLSPGRDLQAQEVRETVLPNGLKVLTKEVHAAPVVATFLWYRVGSRNENVGTTGLSHQIEHLMFKGTRKLRTGDIDRLITGPGEITTPLPARISRPITSSCLGISSTWPSRLRPTG